jgi:hypothetical protein
MTHVTGAPFMDVTRARDGQIRMLPSHASLHAGSSMNAISKDSNSSTDDRTFLNGGHTAIAREVRPRTTDVCRQGRAVAICKTEQRFAYIENKCADTEKAMSFRQGVSGNPHGNRHRTRHLLNQEFMQALLLNFRHQGKKAIEKVARNQPAVYLKILALLVPREMKVEHSEGVKSMSDEQLESAIEAIQAMLAAKAGQPGDSAKVIEGVAAPALPGPPRKVKRKVRKTENHWREYGSDES